MYLVQCIGHGPCALQSGIQATFRPRDIHPSRQTIMQEISIKRPSRGTPAPATPPKPGPSPLILPEEPEDSPAPAAPSSDDEDEPGQGSGVAQAGGKKVFIRTFGCQMNEYDSDKMVDVLRQAHGASVVSSPEEADVLLFNTCSVREKAQEKVFSDLGRVRHLKQRNPDLLIGVGGCVASQEGAAIVERAPFVDLVFGPQTLHRLPGMIEARRRSNRPQVDISFPEIEKFDHLPPPRKDGASAFVSIMEGCSKYCSFCVVPYTRGEEVSRPFEDVLTEVADLADQGVKEVTLLGQHVNAYRGAMGAGG